MKLQLQVIEGKLGRAESLLEKLSGEKGRWASRVQELNTSVEELPARTLLVRETGVALAGERPLTCCAHAHTGGRLRGVLGRLH